MSKSLLLRDRQTRALIGSLLASPIFVFLKTAYTLRLILFLKNKDIFEQAYSVARKALGAPHRRTISNVEEMTEALHSVGVSATFLAFVVLVLNVKLKLGMFSDSSNSKIVMSDKKQGAAFHFVLHKFGVFTVSLTKNRYLLSKSKRTNLSQQHLKCEEMLKLTSDALSNRSMGNRALIVHCFQRSFFMRAH